MNRSLGGCAGSNSWTGAGADSIELIAWDTTYVSFALTCWQGLVRGALEVTVVHCGSRVRFQPQTRQQHLGVFEGPGSERFRGSDRVGEHSERN